MTDAPAIRTVREDDNVHVVEARIAFGGPFNGRDSYGTLFSARTDFGLDLHPHGIPVLFNHGFDPDFGLHPLGFSEPTSAFRVADDGVWVNLQLDKRNQYYATRVRPLLDRQALGVSQGSAEHSVEIDARTGEVMAWPLHEISLTPTEANPWSVIAARTGDVLRIVASRATNAEGEPEGAPVGGKDRKDIPDEDYAGPDKSFPIVDQASVDSAARLIGHADDPEAVKAKVIAIAKRKGLDVPDSWKADSARSAMRMQGGDAAMAASAIQTVLYLRDCEAGEADQVAMLDDAVASLQRFITAELAEPAPADEGMPGMAAMMSAVRLGRRNSAADQEHIDAIHQHVMALGASAHMGDEAQGDDDSGEDEAEAARSGETVPAIRVVEPADPDAERIRISRLAATAAEAALRAFRGDVG